MPRGIRDPYRAEWHGHAASLRKGGTGTWATAQFEHDPCQSQAGRHRVAQHNRTCANATTSTLPANLDLLRGCGAAGGASGIDSLTLPAATSGPQQYYATAAHASKLVTNVLVPLSHMAVWTFRMAERVARPFHCFTGWWGCVGKVNIVTRWWTARRNACGNNGGIGATDLGRQL